MVRRREFLAISATPAAGSLLFGCDQPATVSAAQPAAAQPVSAGGERPADETSQAKAATASPAALPTEPHTTLADAASKCVAAGEACLSHCLRRLAAGDTSMAECSAKVHQMLAICRAVPALATTSSTHLGRLATLCRDVCRECQAACAPHAAHHAECRNCMTTCGETIAATEPFSTVG